MPKSKSPSINLLNQICDVIDERKLTEVYLRDGEITLRVRRESMSPAIPVSAQSVPVVSGASPAGLVQETGDVVTAPMPGVFYRTAAPDEPHFVEEGDRVSVEDTLCLIEAMKIFNSIKPEFPCQIVEILVDHDTAVEFEQPLFRIKRV